MDKISDIDQALQESLDSELAEQDNEADQEGNIEKTVEPENNIEKIEKTKEEPESKNEEVRVPDEPVIRGLRAQHNAEWSKLSKELRDELLRIKSNSDQVIKDREHQVRKYRNITEYNPRIKEIAKETGDDPIEIVKNRLSWVHSAEINPDLTIIQAIRSRSINLNNPAGLIRFLSEQYEIPLDKLAQVNPAHARILDENEFLKQQQRAAYIQQQFENKNKEEIENASNNENIEQVIKDFVENNEESIKDNFDVELFEYFLKKNEKNNIFGEELLKKSLKDTLEHTEQQKNNVSNGKEGLTENKRTKGLPISPAPTSHNNPRTFDKKQFEGKNYHDIAAYALEMALADE